MSWPAAIAALAFVLFLGGLVFLAILAESKANQELKKFQRSVKSGKGFSI